MTWLSRCTERTMRVARVAPPSAIVIGLDTLPGLQTARILAARGVPVTAIASDPSHHNCRTRVCREILFADCRTDEFVDTLVARVRGGRERAVLVPCIDPAVLAVSRHRDRLTDDYRVVLCDDAHIRMLTDKVSFYRYTGEHGFAIPKTAFLADKSDACRAADEFEFPVVLKPSIRLPAWEAKTSLKAIRCDTPEELLARFDQCRSWTDMLILQQWIEGGDDALLSFNGYFDTKARPLATFIARKIRQWPPHVGFSSLGEECRDDFVLDESIRLFQELNYRGLAYVEFKRDTRTGQRFMIEANVGRPTGRSAIAEAGGVELLYTMYCDAVGLPLPESRVQTYRGAKWIDLRHDFMSALYYWRKGELSITEWLRSWRGKKAFAYFSWSDPLPFVFDILRMLKPAAWIARRPARSVEALNESRDGVPPI